MKNSFFASEKYQNSRLEANKKRSASVSTVMKVLMYILVVVATAFVSLLVFSEVADCVDVSPRYEMTADNSFDKAFDVASFAVSAGSPVQHFSATAKRMLSELVGKIRHACVAHARMAIDCAHRNAMVDADVNSITYRPGRIAAATRLNVVIRHLII